MDARSPRGTVAWLGLMFFLLGMSPGFFIPALTNLLTAKGFDSQVIQWAWLTWPVAALLSPVGVGSLADNHFSAQRVLGVICLISSALIGGAFFSLEAGHSPWIFVGLLFASCFVSAPMWSLLASISMTHLKAKDREFPIVRLGGTLGWFAAGFVTSYVLHADGTVVTGFAAGMVRALCGALAFFLPDTPPRGTSRSIRSLLGFDAFRLMRERDHAVFFVATALLSIPLAAFYMWAPKHLADLGDTQATATMAFGQISEIVAMLLLASLMTRCRVKTLLTLALGLSAIRYGLFAWSGASESRLGLWIGISFHGLCYTFYFITAQLFVDRRVPVGMRSQAQGLISLVSNGFGTLMGVVFVRWLYDQVVVTGDGGWALYWSILGAMIAGITLGFALLYVGMPASKRSG